MLEEKTFPYDNFLQIFAFHVGQIMTMEPGERSIFHTIPGLDIDVQTFGGIYEAQFYIDDKWVGNRHGAKEAFVKLIENFIKEN